METKAIVKEWGNSLGIIIPKEIARKEDLKVNDEIVVDIIKKKDLMDLFGSLKFKKGSQELKDEARKEWGD